MRSLNIQTTLNLLHETDVEKLTLLGFTANTRCYKIQTL